MGDSLVGQSNVPNTAESLGDGPTGVYGGEHPRSGQTVSSVTSMRVEESGSKPDGSWTYRRSHSGPGVDGVGSCLMLDAHIARQATTGLYLRRRENRECLESPNKNRLLKTPKAARAGSFMDVDSAPAICAAPLRRRANGLLR